MAIGKAELRELAEGPWAVYPLPKAGEPRTTEYHTNPKYPCLFEFRRGEWMLQFRDFGDENGPQDCQAGLGWLITPDGMVWLLERMRKRGWRPLMGVGQNGKWWCAIITDEVPRFVDTLPEAVALAALVVVREGR